MIGLQALATSSQECVLFVMGWHQLPLKGMALAVHEDAVRYLNCIELGSRCRRNVAQSVSCGTEGNETC